MTNKTEIIKHIEDTYLDQTWFTVEQKWLDTLVWLNKDKIKKCIVEYIWLDMDSGQHEEDQEYIYNLIIKII